MQASVFLRDDEYVFELEETQIILGSQGGLSDQNIQTMLELLYGKRVDQVVLRPQGGLSPENIKDMLEKLYKRGEPKEIILVLKGPGGSL